MKLLVNFDQIWCGKEQIPASLLLKVSEDHKTTSTLSSLRFLLALCLLFELFGYFFITVGLATYSHIEVFFIGVFLKICFGILGSFFQNKSGILLSLELQKYLGKLTTHSLEIRSFLADQGCSESEINSLQSLPSDVYRSELNSYQKMRFLNIGAPLACGFAFLVNGDFIISLIVIILGLASFPIGERFFKESTFRKDSKLRLGLAAQVLTYVEKIYNEHVFLTVKVNLLSQLPLLLFAIRFLWNTSGQLLSSFYGLTQGLAGLTGTLAFQQARVMAIRATATTTHMVHALSNPYLIVTPQRWNEHCLSHKKYKADISSDSIGGLLLKNFSPHLPFQEKNHISISCFIPSGSVCILRAPSGKGKSTFLLALNHLIEHTGDIFFLSHGKVCNVHELSREEFDAKIFFLREENIGPSMRIIDLFKQITFIKNEPFLQEARTHFDSLLIDLAWKSPDNLIVQEIKNLETKKLAVFPYQMLDFLKDLRKNQIIQIQSLLEKSQGNLAMDQIFPERNFATLSSGEKRRLLTLIALESCRAIKTIRLVILDEPLTHLDKSNINYQLQAIQEIQELTTPPSILIISHHFIEEMQKTFKDVQELSLFSQMDPMEGLPICSDAEKPLTPILQ